MKNYRTTATAIVMIIASIVSKYGFDMDAEFQAGIVMLGVAIGLHFAKDSNVTGGTKPQTNEAIYRAKS